MWNYHHVMSVLMQNMMPNSFRLWNELRQQITKEECSNIFDLETRLTPLLLDMKTKVSVLIL